MPQWVHGQPVTNTLVHGGLNPVHGGLGPPVHGSANSFNPVDLFGGGIQGGWYDPSDLSTMFQDTAGTTPVTTPGQSVARINDKSGNGNHLTQATAANQPTYQAGGGLAWLDFDGANDLLDSTGPAILSQPNSAMVSFRLDAGGAAQHLFDGVGGNRHAILIEATNSVPQIYAGAVPAAIGNGLTPGTDYVIEGVFNTTSSRGYLNGVVSGTVDAGAMSWDRFRIGGFQAGVAPLNGRIYGILFRDSALTAGERANMQDFMKNKSGAIF